MEDKQVLIEQMVSDISNQAVHLDEIRLQLFLNWLKTHSCKTPSMSCPDGQAGKQTQVDSTAWFEGVVDEHFQNSFRTWLKFLPIQNMLWEYHLILGEIVWWRELDSCRLTMIL